MSGNTNNPMKTHDDIQRQTVHSVRCISIIMLDWLQTIRLVNFIH